MDNLGTEVGQKMRSAVKAKLIELGTGGLAGYIDDELPDYVMIMIANKRSKQQMIGDLQLFLGSQTELFVTWLHEVLQKLQEVTLPAAVVHKTKRKSDGSNEAPIAGKKEKKEKKKEKEKEKKAKKIAEQATQQQQIQQKNSNQQLSVGSAASITDVFADHLLQKAKKTMQTESIMSAKVKKGEILATSSSSSTAGGINKITRDEFDIPTITEISESVEEISRKKDLEELSRLQKKIYQAKAKLKQTEMVESEDDDCLNIGAEGEELDEVVTTENAESQNIRKSKVKNPIVYKESSPPKNDDRHEENQNKSNRNFSSDHPRDDKIRDFDKMKKRVHITFSSDQREKRIEDENREIYRKKPIHERLGFIRRSPIRSSGGSIVSSSVSSNSPSIYRRLDTESRSFSPTVARSSRSLERNNEEYSSSTVEKDEMIKDKANRQQQQQKDNRITDNTVIMRRRIGSRVIVAPPKKITDGDDDYNETNEKSVSSMIKIKPRPSISPSKQASKNLLLRAVAEAQKSTALIKPKKDLIHSERSPKRLNTKSQKLHTKLYHNRNSSSTGVGGSRGNIMKRVTKDNIVVEIKSNKSMVNQIDDIYRHENYMDDDDNDDEGVGGVNKYEDEYVPEPIHDRGDSDNDYVYIPQTINFDTVDDTSESGDENESFSQNKTQFVVTLDDKSRKKYTTSHHQKEQPQQQKACLYNKNLNGIEKIERPSSSSTNSQDNRRDRLKLSTNSTIHNEKESSISHENDEYEYTSPKRSADDRKYEDKSSNLNLKSSSSSSNSSKFIKAKEQIKNIIKTYETENENNNKTTSTSTSTLTSTSTGTMTSSKVQQKKVNLQKENYKIKIDNNNDDDDNENSDANDGSLTPPLPKTVTVLSSIQVAATTTTAPTSSAVAIKRKRSPIKFDIDIDQSHHNTTTIKSIVSKSGGGGGGVNNKEQQPSKSNSDSSIGTGSDTTTAEDNTHKISIKKIESIKKYENIPESLNSIAVEAPSKLKVKERCKYFPTCTRGDICEYYHPTTPCKAFPNCKFVEKCLYLHPKCKYDLTCNRINCNFSHSQQTSSTITPNVAPPLASHVVPVQNYKSISANALPAICKYYPNCTNSLCNFYHPKLCRFGKNCMNKVECNFYHFDLPVKDKFKWVASLGS